MGNIQEAQSTVTKTHITETNLHAALTKAKGSGTQLVSWAVKDFTSKGDNYVGVVTSVEVKYILDGKESMVNFVAKLGPPQPTKVLHDSINYAFMKEARVYLELIPALNSELTSIGLKPLRIPECFYATWESEKEVIYLKDLRPKGYKSYDRKKGLDLAHTTLVLKELARLHASSLLLQVKEGFEALDVKYTFLKKDCFDITENTIKLTKDILDGHIEKSIAVLKEIEGYSKAVHWLERLKPHAFEKMLKQLRVHTRFDAVCHGDCWSNNALFRYDEEGNPISVRLIDLQLVRRASLAIDLNYFFYNSLNGTDRKENLENYLDTYYASFKKVIEAGGLEIPFTRPELYEEYKTKHLYGILWAMTFVPMIASENEEEPEWSPMHDPDGDSKSFAAKQKDSMFLLLEKNPEMKSRFLSIFDVVVDGEDH